MRKSSAEQPDKYDANRGCQTASHDQRLEHIIGQSDQHQVHGYEKCRCKRFGHPDPDNTRNQNERGTELQYGKDHHYEGQQAGMGKSGKFQSDSEQKRLYQGNTNYPWDTGRIVVPPR